MEKFEQPHQERVKKNVTDQVSRILAAECRFERGKELLRLRLFKEASQAIGEAVAIYPEEGEFYAFLGWCIFQTNPKDRAQAEQALEALERAIRLNPKMDKAYLFMGFIFKAMGRPDKAEKQFEKAVQVNPDCAEALRELGSHR